DDRARAGTDEARAAPDPQLIDLVAAGREPNRHAATAELPPPPPQPVPRPAPTRGGPAGSRTVTPPRRSSSRARSNESPGRASITSDPDGASVSDLADEAARRPRLSTRSTPIPGSP